MHIKKSNRSLLMYDIQRIYTWEYEEFRRERNKRHFKMSK